MSLEQQSVCDEKIYKKVFDTNSEVIRNFIFYKCGDMARAEDITQNAFIKLWENCSKVIFQKAKSFLMKVAQNAFFNEQDHKKVVLKYNQNVRMNKYDITSPEFLMEEKEFMVKLQTCIAHLPVRQREVFLLSRKDKKTYREIAEIIGITQKAVERRMHLALKELRQKIDFKI